MKESSRLTDAEWKIMVLLWQEAPQTLMQLTHRLEQETGWTKHTVIALLKRMIEKKTVRVEDDGRAKAFYPAVEKEQIVREQTDALMKRLFGGKALLMVSNLVDSGQMSDREIEELAAMLEEARQKREV